MTCKNCIHDRVCPHLKDTEAEKCGAYTDKANYAEVVRCKDCKHGALHKNGTLVLCAYGKLQHSSHFCGRGERRDT